MYGLNGLIVAILFREINDYYYYFLIIKGYLFSLVRSALLYVLIMAEKERVIRSS